MQAGAFAVGVGCRRGCGAEAIIALVRAAREGLGTARPATLFTLADKLEEPGLRAAAALLGLDLVGLPRAVLAAALPGVVTRSARVEAAVGVPSVAEAAALAGAGWPAARLVVPRRTAAGATCAVAVARGQA